ncbi:MAG: hypothetical protein NVSMB7_02710 [Chitinophagaceae bacterium]
MKPATIVLFTYKRISSLRKCLASLSACELSAASDLIVFSDAPKNDADAEKVAVVRAYLHTLNQFKSVRIVERSTNMGVDYNIINGIKEIETHCEKFIILEDDVVFAENFLLFMNQALSYYQNYPEVLSVSGFSFVHPIPAGYAYDSYFTHRSWSWGWGSWASKIKQVDWDVKDFDAFARNKTMQSDFNNTGGSDLTRMLLHTMNGKIRAWDIRLFYYQFKHRLVTLYPVSSKTINIGFTKEGSNTFGYNRYKPVLDESNKKNFLFPESSSINQKINTLFLKKNNLPSRIKTRVFSMIGIK